MGNTSSCCSCSPSQVDYQNFISNMDSVKEMSQIEALISHIDELLNAIDTERQVAQPSQGQVGSSINSGGGLLEELLKRSKRHICKRDIMKKLNRETRKVVIDVTNQAAHIHWLGVAFSVVGYVLERNEQVSSNRGECIDLFRYMYNLARYIKQLDDYLLHKEKLHQVLQFIVKGCLMCISQMESHALSKFFAAPVAAEDLQKFQTELGREYQELSLEAIMAVLNRIPVVLPPSQGIYPQAVGIENAGNSVIELLDMRSKSVRAVVIYGQGGIGKTTLATAVFSKLDLKNYKHCRVIMEQNCLEADLKLLQQQILRDLYDHNIELRNFHEGREELSKNFEKRSSQPVFIFVDNALKESDLEKLIPISSLASLREQSRILVTTRNLTETHIILQARIEFCSYPVPSLPQDEAQKLLCELALGSGQERFDPTIDIEGLLQICQGVPLALKIAGAKLCAQAQSVQACKETVEYLKSSLLGGEGEVSERMVDFVYNRLEASCKEAFLDIVFFFCNWEQDRVAFSVGEVEFQELQRAALVNITDEGRVNVHDIVKARGRMLSPDGERITDRQSLSDVLQDKERIKKTKGIVLFEELDLGTFKPVTFELEACHLNLMKRCLRVLILGKSTRIVNGECKGAFENLRFLWLEYHNYSLMDVGKHPKLAVFIGNFYEGYEFCEFSGVASSLKYMHINGAILVNLTTTLSQLQSLRSLTLKDCRAFDSLPETIGNLPSLEKLDFEHCSTFTSLPHSFGNLSSLKELNFTSCSSLVSLPDSFGNSSSLKELNFNCCSSLVSLPDSFGNSSSLEELNLSNCSKMVSLPDSFGNLSSLKQLKLSNCTSLVSLPDSFGNLSSLKELNFKYCSSLVSLPNSFGNLSSLKGLDLSECTSLVSLPDSFENLSSLKQLHFENCSSLVSLPDSFGNLSSLKELNFKCCSSLVSLPDSFGNFSSLYNLNLSNCTSLVCLPDSFENLSSLKELNLSNCVSLVSLSDSFGNLSSLKELKFEYCSSLVSLPESFGNLPSLKELDLSNCSSLINLSNNFGNLFSLVTLYLYSCTQLCVLPESFRNLASVKLLILGKCEKLSNLPQNFGQLKCLKYVSIHGCSVLQTLSADFECLSSLIAIEVSECPQLEEYTMDKLAKMKGLMIVNIDGSPMLKKRWEQVKEQYSLQESWYDRFSYADVMSRAFFHSESKFLHLDENGQFEESPCLTGGVKLYFLLTASDLTSPSNSRCLEAMKKKWMEGGQMMMIIVEMGGSWEESETRVRQALRHLPSGTRAWIAPDNRARLWFAYSMYYYLTHVRREEKVQNCIVSTSTSVDEEGRRKLHDFDFIIPDHAPDFGGRDTFQQLLSPILEAEELLWCGDGDEDAKRMWMGSGMLMEMRMFMIRRRMFMIRRMERLFSMDGDGFQ